MRGRRTLGVKQKMQASPLCRIMTGNASALPRFQVAPRPRQPSPIIRTTNDTGVDAPDLVIDQDRLVGRSHALVPAANTAARGTGTKTRKTKGNTAKRRRTKGETVNAAVAVPKENEGAFSPAKR